MRISCCSCICGNIRIKGQFIPQSDLNTYISNVENHHIDKIIFLINPNEIKIQNYTKIKGNLLCKYCSDMKCMECKTVFHFFSYNGKLYMKGIQLFNNQKMFSSPRFSRQIQNTQIEPTQQNYNNNTDPHKLVPSSYSSKNFASKNKQIDPSKEFRALHTINQFNECQNLKEGYINKNLNDNQFNEDDTDFEIMFSNKYIPLVGSYKNNMSIPHDGICWSSCFDTQSLIYLA